MLRSIFLGLVVLIGLTGAVAAQSLDDMRVSGAIGERFDGLTVARDASGSALAAQVNRQRQEIYRARAAEQGVTAEQVGQVYAREIRQRAPRGTWFLDRNGRWQQ